MKSKYPKEYSNLKKMDINVLKRRNELSSSRSFDCQERCKKMKTKLADFK